MWWKNIWLFNWEFTKPSEKLFSNVLNPNPNYRHKSTYEILYWGMYFSWEILFHARLIDILRASTLVWGEAQALV